MAKEREREELHRTIWQIANGLRRSVDCTSRDYRDKQKLQFSIFPEGIYYSKKIDQPRTLKINSVFTLNARLKGLVEEKETGTSEVIFKNSGLVALKRIESI